MKKGFWTADWFAGLAYSLVFIFIAYVIFGGGFYRAETAAYDLGMNWTSAVPDPDIAVIAIDDSSISTLGRWPWPRDYHAALIDKLSKAGANVIAFDILMPEAQVDQGSVYIKDMEDFYDKSSLNAAAPFAAVPAGSTTPTPVVHPTINVPAPVRNDLTELRKRMQTASETLDADVKLAASMKADGNVVVPMLFTLGEPLGRQSGETPDYILANALGPEGNAPDDQQPQAAKDLSPPIAILGKQASIGAFNDLPDPDGVLRSEVLVVDYYKIYYPSMALMVAMKHLNLKPEDVQVQPGQGVKVGKLFIGTSPDILMRNFYYSGSNASDSPFPVYSYADVYLGKVPMDNFKNKIVIIGPTPAGLASFFPTPTSPYMAPATVEANVVSSILQQNFFTAPGWSRWVTLLAVLLVAAYLAVVLPRLKPSLAAIISVGIVVALLAIEFGVLKSKFLWIPLIVPTLLLITGHLVVTVIQSGMLNKMLVRSEADSAESNKMLGLAFQGQGQLDMAFEKFRKCPMDDAIADLLYNLALDYERKRQFNKAGSVYHYINEFNPKFRDVAERMNRSKQMEGTVILGGGTASASGTMILGDGTVQKPMLGRYQVEKELGKGAMGVVYLGRDPKINRVVAIKTMALSQEFDADELTEVKARFFREAETAGRLNHPNIVTIYDAGEEHDLAYIAMEFLKGKDLVPRTKANALLAPKTVLEIIAKAADALDYAH
ncbi:MAG TPA: serine/threonine-protein kinase, partial [Gammaproteobacteria bacterium]|nr:serine/threonine-protein kinase [Gammaproteobacteria bacterium]